jgi:hypothetical protein
MTLCQRRGIAGDPAIGTSPNGAADITRLFPMKSGHRIASSRRYRTLCLYPLICPVRRD